MSKQIAVRLPDDVVEFIDDLVAHDDAVSRAEVVSHALARERRRRVAARETATLAKVRSERDMDGLAEYAGKIRLDDLS